MTRLEIEPPLLLELVVGGVEHHLDMYALNEEIRRGNETYGDESVKTFIFMREFIQEETGEQLSFSQLQEVGEVVANACSKQQEIIKKKTSSIETCVDSIEPCLPDGQTGPDGENSSG